MNRAEARQGRSHRAAGVVVPPVQPSAAAHLQAQPDAVTVARGEWFADARLTPVDGIGHFVPVEAPEVFAETILSC